MHRRTLRLHADTMHETGLPPAEPDDEEGLQMTKMKRAMAVLLCAVLLFGAAPLGGLAGLDWHWPDLSALFATKATAADPTSGTCGENLTWRYNTSTQTLTISGTGAMLDYSRSFYNESYVTTAPWRQYYDTMKTLVIGNGVTSIGDCAFAACAGLTSIVIPDSVTSIGAEAFAHCKGLTSFTVPDNVSSIGEAAFYNCPGLTSVTIPDSVTSIGNDAFAFCIGLTSIAIPGSVTSIGDEAFVGCEGLTSVTIPDSVTSIGWSAFDSCTGLTSITIPDSVTSIGGNAFYNTSYYNNNANWDAGVLYIGHHLVRAKLTLSGAYSIRPGTVSIAGTAFDGSTALTSVTIPDSVTSIGERSFLCCKGLTSVTIPDSVTRISEGAFYGCSGLTSITVLIGNPVYHSAGNCLIETESKTLIAGCKTSIIPSDGSVIRIGDYAFVECTGLTNITISNSITSIGKLAFNRCVSLTNIYYDGTAADWEQLTIGSGNDPLKNARLFTLCEIVGTSLSLNDAIGINVYVRPSAPVADAGYVCITGPNGLDQMYYFRDLTPTKNGYKLSAVAYSTQMSEPVTMKVYDETGKLQALSRNGARLEEDVFVTSVAAYLEAVQENPNSADGLRQLTASLANYGAYAQLLFDAAQTLTPDSAKLSTVCTESVQPYETVFNGTTPQGFSYYGSSLVLKEYTALRLYFSVNETMPVITVDGEPVEPKANGDYYYVEIPGIAAPHLDTAHRVCFDDYEVTVSALSYVYSVLSMHPEMENLVNTCKALFLYNAAANTFFNV